MKRQAVFIGVALTALTGAASVAGPFANFAGNHGPAIAAVTRIEAAQDGAAMFHRVDVDQNGVLDIEEFAAQAVVQAELARLNRLVLLGGEEARHVPLPRGVEQTLTASMRATLDAVARQEFHAHADSDGALGVKAYTTLRLAVFDEADRNNDGQLIGREPSGFAIRIAQLQDQTT